jgi:hypothetical protein
VYAYSKTCTLQCVDCWRFTLPVTATATAPAAGHKLCVSSCRAAGAFSREPNQGQVHSPRCVFVTGTLAAGAHAGRVQNWLSVFLSCNLGVQRNLSVLCSHSTVFAGSSLCVCVAKAVFW